MAELKQQISRLRSGLLPLVLPFGCLEKYPTYFVWPAGWTLHLHSQSSIYALICSGLLGFQTSQSSVFILC